MEENKKKLAELCKEIKTMEELKEILRQYPELTQSEMENVVGGATTIRGLTQQQVYSTLCSFLNGTQAGYNSAVEKAWVVFGIPYSFFLPYTTGTFQNRLSQGVSAYFKTL